MLKVTIGEVITSNKDGFYVEVCYEASKSDIFFFALTRDFLHFYEVMMYIMDYNSDSINELEEQIAERFGINSHLKSLFLLIRLNKVTSLENPFPVDVNVLYRENDKIYPVIVEETSV